MPPRVRSLENHESTLLDLAEVLDPVEIDPLTQGVAVAVPTANGEQVRPRLGHRRVREALHQAATEVVHLHAQRAASRVVSTSVPSPRTGLGRIPIWIRGVAVSGKARLCASGPAVPSRTTEILSTWKISPITRGKSTICRSNEDAPPARR